MQRHNRVVLRILRQHVVGNCKLSKSRNPHAESDVGHTPVCAVARGQGSLEGPLVVLAERRHQDHWQVAHIACSSTNLITVSRHTLFFLGFSVWTWRCLLAVPAERCHQDHWQIAHIACSDTRLIITVSEQIVAFKEGWCKAGTLCVWSTLPTKTCTSSSRLTNDTSRLAWMLQGS
jgi:hypothetical protein